MTKYTVEITCLASLPADELGGSFDAIADALRELAAAEDADLGMDLATGALDVTLTVKAVDEVEALSWALGSTRTALHAAGHSTPGWEEHFENVRQEVRKQDRELA